MTTHVLSRSCVKDPTKAILEFFSPPTRPLKAYKQYLRATFNPAVSHESVSILSNRMLGLFYQSKYPCRAPKYIDLASNGGDVSKLEDVLGVRLVILKRSGHDSYYKLHDRRIYDKLSGVEDAPTWIFRLENFCGRGKDKTCDVLRMEDFEYNQMETESAFSLRGLNCKDRCLVSGMMELLGIDREHSHGPLCDGLAGFLGCAGADRWDAIGSSFILVTHIRSTPLNLAHRMMDPAKQVFGVLAVIDDPLGKRDYRKMRVLSVTNDDFLYELKESYALRVRTGQDRANRGVPRQPFPGCFDLSSTDSFSAKKKRVEESDPPPPPLSDFFASVDVDEPQTSCLDDSCPCPCRYSERWSSNMSRKGPQALYKTQTSIFDLLKALGRLSPKNEAKITKACNLSIGSFDVESFGAPISDAGNEDAAYPAEAVSGLKLPRQVFAVHKPVMIGLWDQLMSDEGEEPLIIEEKEGETLVANFVEALLDRRDQVVTAKYGLLSSLFEDLERFKKEHFGFYADLGWIPANHYATKIAGDSENLRHDIERELEDDLYGEIVQHEVRQEMEARDMVDQEPRTGKTAAELRKLKEARKIKAVELAWRHSIFGLLEHRLHALALQYDVFAFNAESFDLVLLCSSMAVYAKQTGRRSVSIQKDVNKVRSMSLEGISLLEAKRLLSPGMSLDGLGKLCGLEESKGIFPFDLFTSRKFLDEPRLPADALSWRNRLNPLKSPSQAAVDEVQRIFDSKGFKSVREYLAFYLSFDVKILQKAMVATAEGYFNVLGLNFIDSRKFTVSSLATTASQAFLARAKRIGMRFVNHTTLYSILKIAMRGGVTAVATSQAGEKVDISPYLDLLNLQRERFKVDTRGLTDEEYLRGCNAHLVDNPCMSKFLAYLDENSLYAHSACQSLPFGAAVCYNAKPYTDKDGSTKYYLECNTKEEEARRNMMESLESQFCQFLVLEAFPQADYAFSDFHSGQGQISFGSDFRRKCDLTVSHRVQTGINTYRQHVAFFNLHGLRWHGDGKSHRPDCHLYEPRIDGEGEIPTCRNDEDELKKEYAARLTAVDPHNLLITYEVVHECEMFHKRRCPDPRRWNPRIQDSDHADYRSVRDLLVRKHPVDSVLGLRTKRFTQEQLVDRIMEGGYNNESNLFGGFVTILGGQETREDDGVVKGSWGFCHQRTVVRSEDLGAFTKMQAELMTEHLASAGKTRIDRQQAELKAKRMLERQLAEEQTVCKTSFHKKGETISLDYFRWLVRERGLKHFRIAHFLYYPARKYLNPFMEDKLQRRYDLRNDPDSKLSRDLLKITLNGIYGFYSLEAVNFTKTRIMSERYIRENKEVRDLLYSSEVVQLTLLGATTSEDAPPDLLYAVTVKQPKADIFNALQISGHILSASRVTFLGKILKILRYFDPRKVEICYTDTDSILLSISDSDFRNLLRPEYVDDYELIAADLFEDTHSSRHQSGLLKLEGIYLLALFRTIKCYVLSNEVERRVRARGVPRGVHSDIPDETFTQNPLTNEAVVRTTCMRPTGGLEISVLNESRTLSHSLNFKRRQIDCVHSVSF